MSEIGSALPQLVVVIVVVFIVIVIIVIFVVIPRNIPLQFGPNQAAVTADILLTLSFCG